jgi:hypothetical protein
VALLTQGAELYLSISDPLLVRNVPAFAAARARLAELDAEIRQKQDRWEELETLAGSRW